MFVHVLQYPFGVDHFGQFSCLPQGFHIFHAAIVTINRSFDLRIVLPSWICLDELDNKRNRVEKVPPILHPPICSGREEVGVIPTLLPAFDFYAPPQVVLQGLPNRGIEQLLVALGPLAAACRN